MLRVALVVIAMSGAAVAEPPRTGLGVGLGAGLNVGTPFVEAQAGWRFERASFLELFADYSYDAAISQYRFHTLRPGVRTFIARFDRFELFHQATAEFGLSSGGRFRTFGDRILGGLFEQGVGIQAWIAPAWSIGIAVSTGYPVWFRTEVAGRYVF